MNFQVQFITHFTETLSYLDSVRIALEGGCRWIQLRMKDAPEDEVRAAAGKALPLCRQYGAVLILDDRVELVRECGADGVHLGLTDMPVAEARRILPRGQFIIGGTANTLEDIRLHASGGADYIGCGPFRFTTTKHHQGPCQTGPDPGTRRIQEPHGRNAPRGSGPIGRGHRRRDGGGHAGPGGGRTQRHCPERQHPEGGGPGGGDAEGAENPVAEMRRVMDIAASIASD